ncbi:MULTISPECIES: hypothetical protein [unclassified Brevundimonas]|uniref:hypothetical protein n=1 Tax=unclassified Brevundimonas TaxID=2622653 RepID=UPI002003C17C|nr:MULTISPECIES: hypothetical protein [unclassified Brevundimonas]MCK6103221.1 hypothetical protein [Brevundimonas sp. EYE_349]
MSMSRPVLYKRRSWVLLTVLVLSTCAFVLASPMLLLFAAMSGMASDSCAGWPAHLFIMSALTLPIAIIGVLINGWRAFVVRNEPRAWWGFAILPLWPLSLFVSTKMAAFC